MVYFSFLFVWFSCSPELVEQLFSTLKLKKRKRTEKVFINDFYINKCYKHRVCHFKFTRLLSLISIFFQLIVTSYSWMPKQIQCDHASYKNIKVYWQPFKRNVCWARIMFQYSNCDMHIFIYIIHTLVQLCVVHLTGKTVANRKIKSEKWKKKRVNKIQKQHGSDGRQFI